MRMRTIDQTFDILRGDDPNTALTRKGFRYLVTSGAIPSVTVGRKRLVDADRAAELLSEGIPAAPQTETRKTGVIRTIAV